MLWFLILVVLFLPNYIFSHLCVFILLALDLYLYSLYLLKKYLDLLLLAYRSRYLYNLLCLLLFFIDIYYTNFDFFNSKYDNFDIFVQSCLFSINRIKRGFNKVVVIFARREEEQDFARALILSILFVIVCVLVFILVCFVFPYVYNNYIKIIIMVKYEGQNGPLFVI